MERKVIITLVSLILIFSVSSVESAFVSGSTGVDGAFNPTSSVALQLPTDGQQHSVTTQLADL